MQKIPERKQKKREKRSKDRRSKSRRRKESVEERKVINEMAWLIISRIPRKKVEHANKKFKCQCCTLFYCVGFDGVDVFCRECPYKLGCLKLASGATKKCNYCERNEVGSESQILH